MTSICPAEKAQAWERRCDLVRGAVRRALVVTSYRTAPSLRSTRAFMGALPQRDLTPLVPFAPFAALTAAAITTPR